MEPLIDEAFLKRLANLKFIVKGRRKGRLAGTHPSPRAGVSVEFADYRDYAPGDDFRYIDWNVYGRLDRLLVKTFVHEVDRPIYLLLDLSASMRLGDPQKARYAARFAAAAAYLGLRGLDRVGLYPFTDRLLPAIAPRHGMGQMTHIVRALQGISPEGTTSIDRAVFEFLTASHESGLVFLVSDLLTQAGYEEGVSRLLHRGDDLVVIQVVAPTELHPTIEGTAEVAEVETGRCIDLTVGRGTLGQYERRLATYLNELGRFFADHRIPYFLVPTDLPLETLIHNRLRAGGVLQ
jgi:uncharacterized protein (DUF58 family)